MRVAVFIVSLFLLLLKGYGAIHTNEHHTGSPVLKYQEIKFSTHLEKKETFIADNTEDEDPENLSARKFRLLAKGYLNLSYLFSLRSLYTCFKARSGYHSPLASCKYITHGVLRI